MEGELIDAKDVVIFGLKECKAEKRNIVKKELDISFIIMVRGKLYCEEKMKVIRIELKVGMKEIDVKTCCYCKFHGFCNSGTHCCYLEGRIDVPSSDDIFPLWCRLPDKGE